MNNSLRLTIITLLLAFRKLSAATLYVSLESMNPTPPYTNWATAATSIQQAVGVAEAGDTVLVTNGDYGFLAVTNPLTLRSVNGPEVTSISARVSLAEGASYRVYRGWRSMLWPKRRRRMVRIHKCLSHELHNLLQLLLCRC